MRCHVCLSLYVPWCISISTRSMLPYPSQLRRKCARSEWERWSFCEERGRKRERSCSSPHVAVTLGLHPKKVSGWYNCEPVFTCLCLHCFVNVYGIKLEGCYTCIRVEFRIPFISIFQRKLQRHGVSCLQPLVSQSQNTNNTPPPAFSYHVLQTG